MLGGIALLKRSLGGSKRAPYTKYCFVTIESLVTGSTPPLKVIPTPGHLTFPCNALVKEKKT